MRTVFFLNPIKVEDAMQVLEAGDGRRVWVRANNPNLDVGSMLNEMLIQVQSNGQYFREETIVFGNVIEEVKTGKWGTSVRDGFILQVPTECPHIEIPKLQRER